MEGNSTEVFDKKKPHRERHSGRKAEKKEKKKVNADKQPNPKAFAFNSAIRAERRFRRKQDVLTKKYHLPEVDRTPLEPPPILIAVVGPPKVGKTTLINNLIKLFTRSPLSDIKGPVTLVTGKKRRVTFIECNNDINCMIDLAKVADLVLLLCDASFGFEMEIFEFLNICQVHGMPRIMGILTHLDMIKNSKTLKNTKKTLKHRFWTEVYPGAKLFYLSGLLHGEYLRNEVRNLGRFISVMKFRPLTWRTTHSYLLGDRYEDLTDQELIRKNPKCDRRVSLYGYIRGVPLKKETSVHIAGLGDFRIQDISYLPDPCPLPEQIKKRALVEKEKLIYAPFSGVGGIVYDKDAVYIELGGSHSYKQKDEDDEVQNIVSNLIDTKETLDVKMKHSELQLFTGGAKITAEDVEGSSEDEKEFVPPTTLYEKKPEKKDAEDLEQELQEIRKNYKHLNEEIVDSGGRKRRKVVFETNDDEFLKGLNDDSDEENDSDDQASSEDEEEIEEVNEKKHNSDYTVLKENKDKHVHEKITDLLKHLGTKDNLSKSKKSAYSENDDDSASETDNNVSEDDSDLESNEKKSHQNTEPQNQSSHEGNDSEDGDEDAASIEQESDGEMSEPEHDLDADDIEGDENIEHNSESDSDQNEDIGLKWKDNLAAKARDAFLDRLTSNRNYSKVVYGVFDSKYQKQLKELQEGAKDDETDDEDSIFRKVSHTQQQIIHEKENMNAVETSLRVTANTKKEDFLDPANKVLIADCFVTGKWNESEDASELLKLDDAPDFSDDDSDVFGDFEDLETGEKHEAQPKPDIGKQGEKRKHEDNNESDNDDKEQKNLAEKKRKLKEKFDAEYDEGEKASFYDDLKTSAEKQAQLNKSVFENMPDDVRVQIEGFRAGMYVRIEFENVPYKFLTNFDPTYPLVIGALNSVEGNIGYVNVRIKKHRWYSKILKTNDPIIVSLGWRRFQTLPIYSKLEDDMKFRYLKYTPQHIGCNAHFWGPITPPGTGFLALQTVDSNPEVLKKQGFRIAATGVVQELDKSTQIMKKLKLIGYPMKIYKKTAFIKGMFHNTVEAAKFEGARIKTVSGIRGQIKKAVTKPEGCFRATFEDKILLSDIVFCRTWYKVDVTEFYKPVRSLLLPVGQKNSWQGVRTAGEIKRERGIRNEVKTDHLYTPIKREEKPFKPLIIPAKLQQALPYKDKPKHPVRFADKKKSIERVAVIHEPKEQEISTMMKMIKTLYEHKQEKQKAEMKERMEKHRQVVEAEESRKMSKMKMKKKEALRRQTKASTKRSKKKESVDSSI